MELSIWFAKSYIANAVSTAIIGTLFGPLFPACLSVANDILPTEVQMISMALMYVLHISSCFAQNLTIATDRLAEASDRVRFPDSCPECHTDTSTFVYSHLSVYRRNDFKQHGSTRHSVLEYLPQCYYCAYVDYVPPQKATPSQLNRSDIWLRYIPSNLCIIEVGRVV